MKYLISDHTPMDDYQWIMKQTYYTIESDEEYIHAPDNNKKILKNNKKHRYIAVTIKILLKYLLQNWAYQQRNQTSPGK